jgi:sarcosine oxidase subunit gamma
VADRLPDIRALPPERLLAFLSADAPAIAAVEVEPGSWLAFGSMRDDPGAIDMSDAYVAFAVTGPGAADLLAQGVSLDLDRLSEGFSGRTRLGDVAVLVWRTAEGFVLRCERSYAEWLDAWLARALRLSSGGT